MTSKPHDTLPLVDSAILNDRLQNFIRCFVLRRWHERAALFMVEPGRRRAEALHELQRWLDPKLCHWHTGKAGDEQALWNRNALESAVCVTGAGGYWSTLTEMEHRRPALVLVEATGAAFLLPDDYGVIACGAAHPR